MAITGTLSEIRAKVRVLTGRPSTAQISDSDVNDAINDFYVNQFPVSIRPQELKGFYELSTVDGTGEYDLPASIVELLIKDDEVIYVLDSDGDVAGEISVYQSRDLFFADYPDEATPTEGVPSDMLIYGDVIYLRQVPDDVYTVKIPALLKPSALSEDSSVVTKQYWWLYIAYGTAIQILMDSKDNDGARALEPMLNFYGTQIENQNYKLLNKRSEPSF